MSEDYVATRGGVLNGQWFSRKEWNIKVLAAERTGIGPAVLYKPTGQVIEHPERDDPKKKHLHDIRADVYAIQ